MNDNFKRMLKVARALDGLSKSAGWRKTVEDIVLAAQSHPLVDTVEDIPSSENDLRNHGILVTLIWPWSFGENESNAFIHSLADWKHWSSEIELKDVDLYEGSDAREIKFLQDCLDSGMSPSEATKATKARGPF